MILGISASGRPKGVTSEAVKAILIATGLKYEYISLSDKNIKGCIGCTRCAFDNRCKVHDDWKEIEGKMLKADAIVFGAPNYYDSINAIGHACLERTFCFRHREIFDLAGKLGVVVSCGYNTENNPVSSFIEKMMLSNKMAVVAHVNCSGYSQCYTCGYGHNCSIGNVVKDYGFIDEISASQLPAHFNGQKDAQLEAYKAGKVLGSILSNRK